jgi:dihydroxyacetone kinase-like protein
MTGRVGQPELARMFQCAAERVRERHVLLSELDSAAGDGDHGSTMLRCVHRLEAAIAAGGPEEPAAIFREAGWALLGVDGGASSSLLGTLFLGMSDGPGAAFLDCRELASAFESGLAAVRKQTKAQPGDKTMMDALVPAVEALSAAANAGLTPAEALARAAGAAAAGAEATKDLVARYGRARHLGEKTRGCQDPGATSIALLFEGFGEALAGAKGEAGNA